jgi:GT2 family glycosyltransferase
VEPREKISVALTNWNGAAHIARCLDALFVQTHPPAEVVVVDNGSTDGSRELLRERYPQVRLIERPVNEGFCRGYNLAIGHTHCPYVLILNTDVFLDRNFLCEALGAICTAPDIGSVAARIYQAGTDRIDYVGLYMRRWLTVVNSQNVSEPEFVFSGSGSALFCRRAMLEDIRLFGEYFDDAFFAYWEDVDLAWRAQLRGWRCLFAPTAVAHHIGSASQGGQVRVVNKPAFIQRHAWKNRYLTLTKNAPLGVLLALLPWLLLAEFLYWPYLLLRIPHRLPVFIQVPVDYLRLFRNTIKKRRCIQKRRRVSDREILKFFRKI